MDQSEFQYQCRQLEEYLFYDNEQAANNLIINENLSGDQSKYLEGLIFYRQNNYLKAYESMNASGLWKIDKEILFKICIIQTQNVGKCLEKLNNQKQAKTILLSIKQDNKQIVLNQYLEYLEQVNSEQSLDIEEFNFNTLYKLSCQLEELHQYENSLLAIDQAIQHDKQNYMGYIQKKELLIKLNRIDEADKQDKLLKKLQNL
ncbi:hypothetical protein pb186bvf_012296 [Paramecium bursaria]